MIISHSSLHYSSPIKRLLDVLTRSLAEFVDERSAPPCGILSHTWAEEEVTYGDMKSANRQEIKSKAGYRKIEFVCRRAILEDLEYAWVDTCCIDKSSSAELSEAINSMWRWYRYAKVCWVHLADLPADVRHGRGPTFYDLLDPRSSTFLFLRCRWFTRGWTLQELLAPKVVHFYNGAVNSLVETGFLGSLQDLLELVVGATKIDPAVLEGKLAPEDVSVAQRMSWAAGRYQPRASKMLHTHYWSLSSEYRMTNAGLEIELFSVSPWEGREDRVLALLDCGRVDDVDTVIGLILSKRSLSTAGASNAPIQTQCAWTASKRLQICDVTELQQQGKPRRLTISTTNRRDTFATNLKASFIFRDAHQASKSALQETWLIGNPWYWKKHVKGNSPYYKVSVTIQHGTDPCASVFLSGPGGTFLVTLGARFFAGGRVAVGLGVVVWNKSSYNLLLREPVERKHIAQKAASEQDKMAAILSSSMSDLKIGTTCDRCWLLTNGSQLTVTIEKRRLRGLDTYLVNIGIREALTLFEPYTSSFAIIHETPNLIAARDCEPSEEEVERAGKLVAGRGRRWDRLALAVDMREKMIANPDIESPLEGCGPSEANLARARELARLRKAPRDESDLGYDIRKKSLVDPWLETPLDSSATPQPLDSSKSTAQDLTRAQALWINYNTC